MVRPQDGVIQTQKRNSNVSIKSYRTLESRDWRRQQCDARESGRTRVFEMDGRRLRLDGSRTVQFRPRGNSMVGKIESGQLCTVVPIDDVTHLKVGDIVLCKVNGNQYIHLIKAIQGKRFQIGNNRGRINGWITANSIFGKCARVEPWRTSDNNWMYANPDMRVVLK